MPAGLDGNPDPIVSAVRRELLANLIDAVERRSGEAPAPS